MTKTKRNRKQKIGKLKSPFTLHPHHYVDAELKMRNKYSEYMDIENPLEPELDLFTPKELVNKYAKEYTFWCHESYLDGMPTNAADFARTYMASEAKVNFLKIMGKKFKGENDMIMAILERCRELHKDLPEKEMRGTDELMIALCTTENVQD